MINFWALCCYSCKREASFLQATWQRVQGQGIVFLGIDYQDTASDGLNFLRTYGIIYPNIVDLTGSIAMHYGVTACRKRSSMIVKACLSTK